MKSVTCSHLALTYQSVNMYFGDRMLDVRTYSGGSECRVCLKYGAFTPFPPNFGDEASTKLEDLPAGVRSVRMRDSQNEGRDPVRLTKLLSELLLETLNTSQY